MEQDVDNDYRTVCSTCLSSDRDLFSLNDMPQIHHIFCLLMTDFAGDRYGDPDPMLEVSQYVCWECVAHMKRFSKFKNQVQNAQDHLRVLAMSRSQESMDHTYMSQSLSCLEVSTKCDYDKIYFDYAQEPWPNESILPVVEAVKSEDHDIWRNNINLNIDTQILEVPEIVLENPVTGVMSHIVVNTDALIAPSATYTEVKDIANLETPVIEVKPQKKSDPKCSYTTDYMSETEMLELREESKQKLQYASSVYKCELCIIGFYTQQQVEDHFVSDHRAKPGKSCCKVCYVYIDDASLAEHTASHYARYTCKLCAHTCHSVKQMTLHSNMHAGKTLRGVIGITKTKDKKTKTEESKPPPKAGDLRKLLSKTTIEGYQCLECDMFFKNSRARKNHVARFHREGLQCDHCKKRFVNRTTLTTHLKLHEGPLPRKECHICHKMVRVIQLKYHVQRHENKNRYECSDCNKVFSHLATYQAHLKYSRAHASEDVFKFPCPMCNKGYPTKEAMQDHFNYQHLGKTAHKCPVCEKPLASRANVEKHMMRVHGKKKEKPRNHVCHVCKKGFTDKKALNQHLVIHSGDRPLACDVCQQTFKHKASLYTHRKRVHKVFPTRPAIEYMETKPQQAT
ncbi:zinc finger protein 676-like [Ostrinia nubilalis]|uniref:zinc finger protein 676-like n=1 Tax=Ostrinia nubilalis TaxID=29057 RepID=UPI00103D43DD|nr:zinc finger protein 676-like isoform X1 [Ostrinia furnacalis]XP_028158562.1 zinc finger protein 676-like isoform X2 [Ostrinia furnacalis]XP_028158563.1 zinc finger protein 676-like isoform X3 [Ostrinia furnacalis]